MLQFSQALGKGYMNGDEFRNMMETMPMVARQVASSMGIAFGQLKDAASAGKVTWDVLLDAITDPAFQDEMKRKADAVQLFQYSWQSFIDKVTYSIGQFDKLTGTSSMVKGALDLMGDGAASAGEKLEALDNTLQALSISSSNAISRLSAQFPALQSAVNSFNSNGFVDELKKMADYASSPMMANLFKLLSIGLSGVTKIGDDFATRKTAMSTLMPGYSMTGETKSTEIPKFGMSKPVEMNMDMIVRDKRLAELVKAYQSYELKQSEFESKFNDIVYGKSGSGKKSSGGSTAINGAILDAQEAQRAYENLIEKGLSPGDKILSDMAQHMGKLNETKREHVRLIAYEADELEFLKVINEEVFEQREQLIKRDAELSDIRLAGIKAENEKYAEMALGAMDVKKSLMTGEQRILSEAGDRWAQYTEMVKAGFLDQADAVRAYVNEFDENAQMMKDIGKSLQSAFADFLFDPLDKGFEGMVQGFANAIKRMMAEKEALQLTQMAGNWGASVSGSGGLMGMIGSGLAGMFGGVAAPMMPMGVAEGLIGDLVGFDGGGYTGSAPRSGGMDGKGGFMAMLHPQETVVDHTKGQKVTEQKQTNIFNFTINGSPASRETQAQMANRVASVLNSGRRIS
jgi:tape measure domain-containing protein